MTYNCDFGIVDFKKTSSFFPQVPKTSSFFLLFLLSSFSLQPDKSGNLMLKSSGELLDKPIKLNAKITSKESVTAVKVEDLTVTMDGAYANKQMEFSSTLTPLRRAGDLFDLQGVRPEALTLNGKVAQSDAENFDIVAFQADAGQNRLTAQGRINTRGDATLSMTLPTGPPNCWICGLSAKGRSRMTKQSRKRRRGLKKETLRRKTQRKTNTFSKRHPFNWKPFIPLKPTQRSP